jgi:HAD superfamily hydrolase (TIGR01509 family)
MLQALIFDVDGTLADTETAHRQAFNAAFAQLGLGWEWDEALYTRLLDVNGGKERIRHYWNTVDPHEAAKPGTDKAINALHAIKTQHYEALAREGQLTLRPGVLRLLTEARKEGLKLAIATTTTPANVDTLLRTPLGPDWRDWFVTVCDAGTTKTKKPAPDVYFAALVGLSVPADDCLAFEDSQNGLQAATAAGIRTLVTPTAYTAQHRFDGALLVLPHLGDPKIRLPQLIPGATERWVDVATLRRWHHGTLFEAA